MANATPAQWSESTELRADRIRVSNAIRALAKKPYTEKRDMSSEEKESFDKMEGEFDSLSKRIDVLEKAWDASNEDEEEETDTDSEDRDMDQEEKDADKDSKRSRSKSGSREQRSRDRKESKPPSRGGGDGAGNGSTHRRDSKEYRSMFSTFLFEGETGLRSLVRSGPKDGREKRNLQMDVDVKGGYMVLPLQMSQNILKKVDDILPLQKKGTVIRTPDAASLGVPTIESNADNGDWTTEIAQINADASLAMGKRQLTPTPVRKRILVSERLLRMAFGVNYDSDDEAGPSTGGTAQGMIEDRLSYTIARTKEIAYMTGNGVGQPLGVFTASTRGVSTGRDVQTGSATGWTWQNMIAGKFTLKVQYLDKAEWFLHRTSLAKIMQIASTTNIPILVNSGIPGTPSTLLERPYNLSENVPSTYSSGAYVGLLGDPRFYWIADSLDITVKMADQLYMETGQIGFFVSAESDGMPVLEEAFVRFAAN